MHIHHGMNRADLDRFFDSIGGQISFPRRTGDVVYSHPALREKARANSRRKDATRELTSFVMKVVRAADGQAAANDGSFNVNREGVNHE